MLCREDDYPPRGGSRVPYGRGPPPPAPPNFRAKGSAYRVMVKGLPMSASWQDLKVRPPLFAQRFLCLAIGSIL